MFIKLTILNQSMRESFGTVSSATLTRIEGARELVGYLSLVLFPARSLSYRSRGDATFPKIAGSLSVISSKSMSPPVIAFKRGVSVM